MIMTNTRKLTGPIIDKGSSTKFLVFFVHGWGSDGNDLIQNWRDMEIKIT